MGQYNQQEISHKSFLIIYQKDLRDLIYKLKFELK